MISAIPENRMAAGRLRRIKQQRNALTVNVVHFKYCPIVARHSIAESCDSIDSAGEIVVETETGELSRRHWLGSPVSGIC